MRWSLLYLTTFLAASSVLEGVLCAPVETVELEARAKISPKKTKSYASKVGLTAGALKRSSATYRKAALKNPHTFTVKNGRVTKTRTPKMAPKGKDADHVLEAQTVAHALRKGGYTTKSGLGKQGLQAAKGRLNDPKNMAFVDAKVNQSKGHSHKSALSGGTPKVDPHVKDYMRRTRAQGKQSAKDIDAALKASGISGVNVQKAHNGVLKKMGIKRREYILNELD